MVDLLKYKDSEANEISIRYVRLKELKNNAKI